MLAHRLGWSLCLPLPAVGWLAAHALAYDLVSPHDHARDHLLRASGHGYLDATPTLLASALTLLLLGLALAVRDGLHGRPRGAAPPWWLAVVPAAGFTVQEHLERLIHTGALPGGVVFETTFAVGLALQVPLGVVAVALARELHALAYVLGCRLRVSAAPSCVLCAGARSLLVLTSARRPRCAVLAAGHAGRAPPRPDVLT